MSEHDLKEKCEEAFKCAWKYSTVIRELMNKHCKPFIDEGDYFTNNKTLVCKVITKHSVAKLKSSLGSYKTQTWNSARHGDFLALVSRILSYSINSKLPLCPHDELQQQDWDNLSDFTELSLRQMFPALATNCKETKDQKESIEEERKRSLAIKNPEAKEVAQQEIESRITMVRDHPLHAKAEELKKLRNMPDEEHDTNSLQLEIDLALSTGEVEIPVLESYETIHELKIDWRMSDDALKCQFIRFLQDKRKIDPRKNNDRFSFRFRLDWLSELEKRHLKAGNKYDSDKAGKAQSIIFAVLDEIA